MTQNQNTSTRYVDVNRRHATHRSRLEDVGLLELGCRSTQQCTNHQIGRLAEVGGVGSLRRLSDFRSACLGLLGALRVLLDGFDQVALNCQRFFGQDGVVVDRGDQSVRIARILAAHYANGTLTQIGSVALLGLGRAVRFDLGFLADVVITNRLQRFLDLLGGFRTQLGDLLGSYRITFGVCLGKTFGSGSNLGASSLRFLDVQMLVGIQKISSSGQRSDFGRGVVQDDHTWPRSMRLTTALSCPVGAMLRLRWIRLV